MQGGFHAGAAGAATEISWHGSHPFDLPGITPEGKLHPHQHTSISSNTQQPSLNELQTSLLKHSSSDVHNLEESLPKSGAASELTMSEGPQWQPYCWRWEGYVVCW